MKFPPFRLDTVNQCLWRGEERVTLTPKAFSMLGYLVERSDRLVTQRELLEALWPNTFVQPEVLKSHVLAIRKALGDDSKEPRFIQTHPKLGYRFIAAVSAETAGSRASSRVVGREGALMELQSSLERVMAGERQIVFIGGEAGIGKTALVDVFETIATNAQSGVRVARGQCVEGYGSKEAYYPILEALGRLARGPRGRIVIDALAAHAPTWLVQLPALMKPEHRAMLQREILGATRERLLREIRDLLETIAAEHPLILLLEDVHWLDHATLDLISVLARGRGRAKLMLIATYRPVELMLADHPLVVLKQDLLARQLGLEIELGPLDEPAVAAYLAGDAGESREALAALVYRRSEGNPLFMVAVLDWLEGRGFVYRSDGGWRLAAPIAAGIPIGVPGNLRQMIELQIGRLSEEEQRALEAASVAGVRFPTNVVAGAAQISAGTLEEACERVARKHQMVRAAEAQRYEFVHSLYREVLYGRIAPRRRSALHLRIGEGLEASHGERSSKLASELALHFELGAAWQPAIRYLRLAAEDAAGRLALRQGVPFLQHALDLIANLPEADRGAAEMAVLEGLGIVYLGLYEGEKAVETLEKLAARAGDCGEIEVQVRALVYLVPVLSRFGAELAFKLVDRILPLNEKQTNPVLRAEARMTSLFWRMLASRWNAGDIAECGEAFEVIHRSGTRLAAASHSHEYGFILWSSTQYREALRIAEENIPVLLEAGFMTPYLYLHLIQVWTNQLLGEWGSALDALVAGIQMAAKNENHVNLCLLRSYMALVYLDALNFEGARQLGEATRPLILDQDTAVWQFNLEVTGIAEAGLGNCERALELLLEARASMYRDVMAMSWYWLMLLHRGLAEAYLLVGDLENAYREAERFLDLTRSTEERTWQALAWEVNARVAIARGEPCRAQEFIAKAVSTMNGFEVPLAHWRVHATAAELHQRAGDSDAAGRHRQLSATTIRKCAASLERHREIQEIFLAATQVRNVLESLPQCSVP